MAAAIALRVATIAGPVLKEGVKYAPKVLNVVRKHLPTIGRHLKEQVDNGNIKLNLNLGSAGNIKLGDSRTTDKHGDGKDALDNFLENTHPELRFTLLFAYFVACLLNLQFGFFTAVNPLVNYFEWTIAITSAIFLCVAIKARPITKRLIFSGLAIDLILLAKIYNLVYAENEFTHDISIAMPFIFPYLECFITELDIIPLIIHENFTIMKFHRPVDIPVYDGVVSSYTTNAGHIVSKNTRQVNMAFTVDHVIACTAMKNDYEWYPPSCKGYRHVKFMDQLMIGDPVCGYVKFTVLKQIGYRIVALRALPFISTADMHGLSGVPVFISDDDGLDFLSVHSGRYQWDKMAQWLNLVLLLSGFYYVLSLCFIYLFGSSVVFMPFVLFYIVRMILCFNNIVVLEDNDAIYTENRSVQYEFGHGFKKGKSFNRFY